MFLQQTFLFSFIKVWLEETNAVLYCRGKKGILLFSGKIDNNRKRELQLALFMDPLSSKQHLIKFDISNKDPKLF